MDEEDGKPKEDLPRWRKDEILEVNSYKDWRVMRSLNEALYHK